MPASLDHPISMDIAVTLITPGPITIYLTLEERLSYFFITGGRQAREIHFTRRFASSGEHITSFTFSLVCVMPEVNNPSLIVRAAGIDGSSLPVKMNVEMCP